MVLGLVFCVFEVIELFLLYLSLFTHLFSVLVLQRASFVQSVFLYLAEILSSPVKTTMRSTEGKQQTGQRVFSGRRKESRKDGQGSSACLLLPSPLFTAFWYY